jgi:tungstate transport system permease protein
MAVGEFGDAFGLAARMVFDLDPDLIEIVGRSLYVSLIAVSIASIIGLPLGAALAIFLFPGRRILAVTLNALMGLPPVVVGLLVYLLLSRAGAFGTLGLLFTPTAMIIAQTLLILPIVASLARQASETLWEEYADQLRSFGASRDRQILTILWDGRIPLSTAVLAGFGRASAEVGAVMIVGGNIDHVTRVMTTSIALETSKGELGLALALGFILITISLGVSTAIYMLGSNFHSKTAS